MREASDKTNSTLGGGLVAALNSSSNMSRKISSLWKKRTFYLMAAALSFKEEHQVGTITLQRRTLRSDFRELANPTIPLSGSVKRDYRVWFSMQRS